MSFKKQVNALFHRPKHNLVLQAVETTAFDASDKEYTKQTLANVDKLFKLLHFCFVGYQSQTGVFCLISSQNNTKKR